MTTPVLALSALCDRRQVAAEVASQRIVEWTIRAAAEMRRERAALNLALVIDRSGSMSGNKLEHVKHAAHHVLDMLDERDRAAIVAYDDQIQVTAPAAQLDRATREGMKSQVGALRPGGWTDLGGGWLEGCRQIGDQVGPGRVTRALLLTDGLANRGITDVEQLMEHARELNRRGVATSTFGVGLDFNEHLLEAMATEGGGHFYYIERAEQIPEVFRRELGELLTVVARETFLSIAIPKGVALEVIGDLPHERIGDNLRIYFGDICAGEERTIYMRALTPPDAPGTSIALRGELGYADLEGKTLTVVTELAFAYLHEAEVTLMPIQEEVLQRAAEVDVAAAATRALKLERAGQRDAAQKELRRTMAVQVAMPAATAAHYDNLLERLGSGLNEAERKDEQFSAYQKRQSRDKKRE